MGRPNKRQVATLLVATHIASRTIEKVMGPDANAVENKEKLQKSVASSVMGTLVTKAAKE